MTRGAQFVVDDFAICMHLLQEFESLVHRSEAFETGAQVRRQGHQIGGPVLLQPTDLFVDRRAYVHRVRRPGADAADPARLGFLPRVAVQHADRGHGGGKVHALPHEAAQVHGREQRTHKTGFEYGNR